MYQSNPRTPIPPLPSLPGAYPGHLMKGRLRMLGHFNVKRSPPGRALDRDRENVDHRQQAKGLRGKG